MDIRKKIKIKFDDDFFREEIRCDYRVTKKQKEIWAIELDLLNELLRVCKKNDIKISVYAGTLLGAIRHKGMIPWDDDIDVALTRTEYEKLCKVAPNEFKHPYFFQNNLTDKKYFFGFSRLRNSLTTAIIKGQDSVKYNNGIYIDIFVLDGYIEDKQKLRKQLMKLKVIEKLTAAYRFSFERDSLLKNIAKAVILTPFHFTLCKVIPYSKVIQWYQNVLQKYNKQTQCLSLITHSEKVISKYWCLKSDLDEIIFVPFEKIEVPIPAKYDEILSHCYGDYMKYPPLEKRGEWHEGIITFSPDIPYNDYLKGK